MSFPQSLKTRVIKEFAGDPCSSFLQQFAEGCAAFLPVPGGSAGCGGASESVEKITLGLPGWWERESSPAVLSGGEL